MLIYLFYFLAFSINGKIVKLPFKQIDDSYKVKFNIGNPPSTKYFNLDMKINITWVGDNYYFESNSTKKHEKGKYSFFLGKSNLEYTIVSDNLFLEHEQLHIDSFYLVHFSNYFLKYDTLSLSYKFDDIRTSLVYNLFNNSIIDLPSFGISHEGRKSGYLYFGGFPKEFINNKDSASCFVNPTEYTWSCKVDKVMIGESVIYKESKYSYFQSSSTKIIAPKSFFHLLEEEFFSKHEECFEREYLNVITYHCALEKAKQFPAISFVFENKMITLNYRDLITIYTNIVIFSIGKVKNDQENDIWIFGQPFLRKYPSLFEHSEGKVTFFSPTPFRTIGPIKNTNGIFLIKIILLILLSSIGFLFWIKYTYQKTPKISK